MEVIHGSIYIEVESVLGIFSGPVTTPPTSATHQRRRGHHNHHHHHRKHHNGGGSTTTSGPSSPTSPSTEKEEDREMLPVRQRAVSSHSPFGPAPSTTSVFAAHDSANDSLASATTPVMPSASGISPKAVASSSSGVSASLSPATVMEAPYPPPLTVQFGGEVHLIDPQARGGAAGHRADAGAAAASRPHSGSTPVEGPRQLSAPASGEAGKASPTSSSRGSVSRGNLAAWESVLHLVDDAESGADDSGRERPIQVSSSTPPRSFHWDSGSSTTETEESTRTWNERHWNGASPASVLSGPLPNTSPRLQHDRFNVRATPVLVSPTCQTVPPHQATLPWLAERLRNDAGAQCAIRWIGPRPRAVSGPHKESGNTTANTDAAVTMTHSAAASAFTAAWYAHLFPEEAEEERNVLGRDAQALLVARRLLRRHCRDLTAAVFPLSQRFAFAKVAIEVRSSAAFDLQEAMQRNSQKGRGKDRDAASNGGPDANCVFIRLATPSEVKKARRTTGKSAASAQRRAKAVEDFFEHIRLSFRGRKSKEKTLSADSSVDEAAASAARTDVHDSNSSGAARTPPDAAQCQPHTHLHRRVLSSPLSGPSSPSNSTAREGRASGHRRDPANTPNAAAAADTFAVRLHLSRLLSPTILAWMKHRHVKHGSSDADSSEEGEAADELPSIWPGTAASGSAGSDRGSFPSLSEWAGAGSPAGRDAARPAVFFKSVYVPLPPPISPLAAAAGDGGSCLAMMLKVNILFKPGLDSAEPF